MERRNNLNMIKIIDNFDKNNWNEKAFHPLQSWNWGEARKEMGIEVLRITDSKNVFQITIHPIPYLPFKIGYLPRSVMPSKEVLEFLYDYGRKNKIIFFKIEPYVKKSQVLSSKFQINSKFKILNSKHPLFPDWTQVLDLTKSEEELLKSMKSKTRYNIKLAQKKGVVIKEESNEKGYQIFEKLYFETCRRQKYLGHTPIYHQIIWNNLKKEIAYILVAYYQNIPLTAYELFYFKDTFYYPYGGSSEEYRNLMATNLIMWEAIKLGKRLGAKKFDMWGSLAPNYDMKNDWSGFTKFKEGYGGEFTQMVGSYDLIINPWQYKIYNFIYSLRKIFFF